MATRFDTIVNALVADYQASTGDTETVMERGRKRLPENADPIRVVFVRDGGKVQTPTRLSPQLVSGKAVKPIRSRVENVLIHIFAAGGADEDADHERAEGILDGMIGALDTVLETALVDEPEYAWFTESDDGARWETYGAKVILSCKIRVGVTRGSMSIVYPKALSLAASMGRGDFSLDYSSDFRRLGGEAA
ncbi:MAG: hypothetical protein AMXMBFR56_76810 [Polyangiaceae bacterium]